MEIREHRNPKAPIYKLLFWFLSLNIILLFSLLQVRKQLLLSNIGFLSQLVLVSVIKSKAAAICDRIQTHKKLRRGLLWREKVRLD